MAKRRRVPPPEYRAMQTKGIPMADKITLKQYLYLLNLGCDGDQIKSWTRYHASQEIDRRKKSRL